MKALLQNTWQGTCSKQKEIVMLHVEPERVFSTDFQWENESASHLLHTGDTTSSSVCIVRQRCEEAWESGNKRSMPLCG